MSYSESFVMLAEYNKWMNRKLYQLASNMDSASLFSERKAFFGSIYGTLNHLAVTDTIWLKRFAENSSCNSYLGPIKAAHQPENLNSLLFDNLVELDTYRVWLDELILEFVKSLPDAALTESLTYANMKGVTFRRQVNSLLIHFFNHQTHHRGQVTTLFSQVGIDVGVTDILALIPDTASPLS